MLISANSLLLAATPIALFVIFSMFYHTEKVLFALYALSPLSINLADFSDRGGGLGLYMPTEPILFGLTILFVFDQCQTFGVFQISFGENMVFCTALFLRCKGFFKQFTIQSKIGALDVYGSPHRGSHIYLDKAWGSRF